MDNLKKLEKRYGIDIGYHESNLTPLNNKGCVGKSGIDKNYKFEKVLILAYEIKANIIVKGGKNAKWYLKKCDLNTLEEKINKQKWRDTERCTMWILEWED